MGGCIRCKHSNFRGPERWEKIFDLLGGPFDGEILSFLFLPATPLSPSRTLEGLFELIWQTSRAFDWPGVLLLELQGNKDTVRCALLDAEVPGRCQKQLTQTLIVLLLKTLFLTPILYNEKLTE